MAINESNSHSNNHVAITCETGGGKGVAVQCFGFNLNHPLVIFDTYGEYSDRFADKRCYSYKTKRNFMQTLAEGWKSKKPFVIAYRPTKENRKSDLEWFGERVWALADGNRILNVYFSEYGKLVESTGQDRTIIGEIGTGGRKFGIRAGFDFQRSAEVPKTIWTSCGRKIIGTQGDINDCKRVMTTLGCSMEDVTELGRQNKLFELPHPNPAIDDRVKAKTHYLLSNGLHDFEKVACIVPKNKSRLNLWSRMQKDAHRNSEYRLMNPEIIPKSARV